MNQERVRLDRLTLRRCARAVRNFANSEDAGTRAKLKGFTLIGLLLLLNALNVLNSYVGRDFMTAIERRSMSGFVSMAAAYIGVFALTTAAAVFYRFTEERLGLLWRAWLTARLTSGYLDHLTYYRLRERGGVDNPDQRIAEDVRTFTTTTLSFTLLVLNASFTIVAFAGVMWSISPLLFVVAVLYATAGSVVTLFFGRPLVWLSYNQADKEAVFRGDLVHIGQNTESIAAMHQEPRLMARLRRHIDELVANAKRMIAVNRNLGFFTTSYNYMIQVIPALIVAPIFIRGECEFGVIPQSAMAFSHLLGAFSLIVTQIQSISSYAAVLVRLTSLAEATEQQAAPLTASFEVVEDERRLAYENLVLRSPRDNRLLVDNLTLSLTGGTRLLVIGPNETAKIALFRATAGIWGTGNGRITRPGPGGIFFLPERPYLPPGTLREVLLPPGREHARPDDAIFTILHRLSVDAILTRVASIDTEHDWDQVLSLAEQQLIAVARVLLAAPPFVLLDRIATTLEPDGNRRVLQVLTGEAISYVTFAKDESTVDLHDSVLELAADASWTVRPTTAARVA